MFTRALVLLLLAPLVSASALDRRASDGWEARKVESAITQVNPMKGLVLFHTYQNFPSTDSLALEFVHFPFSDVVKQKGKYNWAPVEKALGIVEGRGHQAVLRFWYVSPGKPSGEPDYIKKNAKYPPLTLKNPSEGMVEYTNWGSPEITAFNSEFYKKLAAKYDGDKRIAFMQLGFGHWSEYHIWDLKYDFGVNFPTYDYQTKFLKEAQALFKVTPWQLSVDMADAEYFPSSIFRDREVARLRFGCFLDTMLAGDPDRMQNNAKMMALRYDERYMIAPMGGEIAYEERVQPMSLSRVGAYNGDSIDHVSMRDHVTYTLANDALRDHHNVEFKGQAKVDRFKEVGMKMGYVFEVRAYHYNREKKQAHLVVANSGTAPAYYDMFFAVGGTRASESLKGLLPGDVKGFYVYNAPDGPITIESDHITARQTIQFQAKTKGTEKFSHPKPSMYVSRYAYWKS